MEKYANICTLLCASSLLGDYPFNTEERGSFSIMKPSKIYFITFSQDLLKPTKTRRLLLIIEEGRVASKSPHLAIFFLCPSKQFLMVSFQIPQMKYFPRKQKEQRQKQPIRSSLVDNLLKDTLKKISVMHVIKLGFAPVSFPPG